MIIPSIVYTCKLLDAVTSGANGEQPSDIVNQASKQGNFSKDLLVSKSLVFGGVYMHCSCSMNN